MEKLPGLRFLTWLRLKRDHLRSSRYVVIGNQRTKLIKNDSISFIMDTFRALVFIISGLFILLVLSPSLVLLLFVNLLTRVRSLTFPGALKRGDYGSRETTPR